MIPSMEGYRDKCATCIFFAQGKNSCYCSHKDATKDEKAYRYYPFSCDDPTKLK